MIVNCKVNFSLLLMLVLVCNGIVAVSNNQQAIRDVSPSASKRVTVSLDFTKALDVGMAQVATSTKWQQVFESLGIPFNVPKCASKFGSSFPSNPFPASKTQLNICYEEPAQVWASIFKGAGDLLVEVLNKQYNINLKSNHIVLNTTELGYFSSMKAAVESGLCDICTSNVIKTQARAEQVNMNCPYGSSSLAFLRSELTPSRFNTSSQLNSSDAIIVVYGGTYFETIAKTMFPAAKLILEPGGYDATYEYIKDGRAHATIADAVDLSYWLTNNRAKCTNCYIKLFGDPYEYGSITTNLYASGSESFHNNNGKSMMMLLLVILLGLFTL